MESTIQFHFSRLLESSRMFFRRPSEGRVDVHAGMQGYEECVQVANVRQLVAVMLIPSHKLFKDCVQ